MNNTTSIVNVPNKYKTKWNKAEVAWGFFFITPIIIGLVLFLAFPLVYAFIVSFTKSGTFGDQIVYMGFENFRNAFNDVEFFKSIGHAFYSSLSVVIGIIISLGLTVLIMRAKIGGVFKLILFLPMVTSSVAISFMWKWMFNPLYGIINSTLTQWFNLKEPIDWLGNSALAMPSMIMMGVWSGLGINIIMFFAALRGVDKSLYEASKIDGANAWKQFIKISVPAVTPILFYVLVTGLIGSLQDFSRFQVMGQGASDAISMPVVSIYYYATNALETGYASTLGIILSGIIFIITMINFGASKLWVKYD